MKNLSLLFIAFLLLQFTVEAQQSVTEQTNAPIFFKVKNHDTNITKLPVKSFYESKADWQYIIDTTWGPGLPLQNKQNIFNYFADRLRENFDGFESLNFTTNTWDSLRNHYYTKIDSNTSHGRFAAIMFHFARQLSDLHTWANNIEVIETPLNPGVPLLVMSGFCNIEHFGAVLSALEDSTIFVLRAVNNHPLGLEPGDIILGYNGELWVDIIQELIEAELPGNGAGSWKNGGTTNSQSSITHNQLLCAGMNWHLFDTIDIIKYSTGDTLHLSVSPLLNLNIPPMLNNEQLDISSIPFPDYFNNEAVFYGILPNTNIGYIYVCSEAIPTFASANQQFNSAALALQNVDALIIDMRWNEGGNAFWQDAFGYWTNEIIYTLEWAFRCDKIDFTLCFDGDTVFELLTRTATWKISKTYCGLNKKEFPIDFSVWHNRDDVALGKDAVVEKALDWINNLVYAHDLNTDKEYYIPGTDSIILNAQVENPNSHPVSIVTYIKNWEGFLDSVFLNPSGDPQSETWTGVWDTPIQEDIFKLDITAKDLVTSESFTLTNVSRFTTAGPVVLDSLKVTYNSFPKTYSVKPIVKNNGQSFAIENLTIKLFTTDSSVTISAGAINVASISPGEIITPYGSFTARVDSNFSGTFNFKFDFMVDGWKYWTDSTQIIVGVEDELNELPTEYLLSQNYPNPSTQQQ